MLGSSACLNAFTVNSSLSLLSQELTAEKQQQKSSEINVLKTIIWLKTVWEQVTGQYIPNCFKNCGFEVPSSEVSILDDSVDNEYEEAFGRLSGTCGPIIYEFVRCDDTLVTEKGKINTNSVDWHETTRHKEGQNNEIKGIETNQYC